MKTPLHKTEGIIIRRFNAGEFDKILVVYTKEHGKILIKAKSLRKKGAKLRETLELFNHVHLMLAYSKNIDAVAGTTIINGFPNLRTDLLALATAHYLSELLDKLIVAPEKDEQIWDLATKTFYFFEEKKHNSQTVEKLLEKFESHLLVSLGHPADPRQPVRLDFIQGLCGQRVESRRFLALVPVAQKDCLCYNLIEVAQRNENKAQ
ncbi:MAG: DNA repair protein RecO [Candidatus Portnoybacteria bacterium]|nr:DNA repair protein RecO [Candidatus Portnoybacteria bacterium]